MEDEELKTDDFLDEETVSEEPAEADEEEKKYTPLSPFDITYGEEFKLYDNMTYVCDSDRCNAGMIRMESGNVCKYYRVKDDKPVKIGGD